MRKTMTIALAAATLAAAGGAAAQMPERGTRSAEITRDSAQQRADAIFERLDANKDDALDQGDRDTRIQARFEAIDGDRDGAVSYEEFTALREERKDRRSELREMRQELMAARDDRDVARGPGMRGDGRRGQLLRGIGFAAAIADADGDGKVTRAEFTNAAADRFDAMDADSDGTVTREERREARLGNPSS